MDTWLITKGCRVAATAPGKSDLPVIAPYGRTGESFRDIPFKSSVYLDQAMDMYCPGSKFILTVREPESWWKPISGFHGLNPQIGDKAESLKKRKDVACCYKAFAYETRVFFHGLPGDLYQKETPINNHNHRNEMMRDFSQESITGQSVRYRNENEAVRSEKTDAALEDAQLFFREPLRCQCSALTHPC